MGAEYILALDESGATATVTSGAQVVLAGSMAVHVDLDTVNAGTPTLDVTVEYSNDNVNWTTPASAQAVAQLTAAGTESARFETEGRYFRLVATIAGGSPDIDFSASVVFFTGG